MKPDSSSNTRAGRQDPLDRYAASVDGLCATIGRIVDNQRATADSLRRAAAALRSLGGGGSYRRGQR